MPAEFHILLVEDSAADVVIIGRALREAGFAHRLTVVDDGDDALAMADRLADPSCPAAEVPDLVLLDLNLPGPDGAQVLDRFKGDPLLRAIPVVVLTTSGRDVDVWRSYQGGANSYIQKPAEYPTYREFIATLRRYWQQTASRPPRRPPGD